MESITARVYVKYFSNVFISCCNERLSVINPWNVIDICLINNLNGKQENSLIKLVYILCENYFILRYIVNHHGFRNGNTSN